MMQAEKLWKKNFIFLLIGTFFMAIAFYFMTPAMPLFLADTFGLGADEAGLYMFVFAAAAIAVRPFIGYLLDVYNRLLIYIVSFIFFLLFFITYATTSSLTLLFWLRFLHGLSWGTMNTSANTLAVDIIPQKRLGEGLGFFGLSMTIATALSPMLSMAIIGRFNYKILFYLGAVFCAAGLLFALTLDSTKTQKKRPKFSIFGMFEPSSLAISIIPLLTQIPYGGIIAFIALYGRKLGIANSGTFFLIFAGTIALSKVVSGRLSDVQGAAKIVSAGLSMLFLGLICIGYFDNIIGYHVFAAVLGLGFGMLPPIFQSMVNNMAAPERRGLANSTYLMFFDSGIGLGMLLFGLLINGIKFSGVFYVSAGFVLAAAILFFAYTLPHYKKLCLKPKTHTRVF